MCLFFAFLIGLGFFTIRRFWNLDADLIVAGGDRFRDVGRFGTLVFPLAISKNKYRFRREVRPLDGTQLSKSRLHNHG